MGYFKLIALGLIIASCSSTTSDQKRDIAANGDGPVVSKETYYKDRGQEKSIKWDYDGYHSQWYLFGKAIFNGDNRDFLKTGTELRQNLMEQNLHDTGVDEYKEDEFEKITKANSSEAEKNNEFNKTKANMEQHLLKNNMHSTGVDTPENMPDCNKVMYMKRRTPDGSCYFHNVKLAPRDRKLAMDVLMGAKGQRFGRNTKQETANHASTKDIMEPNPFEISQRLFNRKDGKTKEAKVINLLAAAWLQSMNHDWFTHGKNSKKRHHKVKGYKGHKHFKSGYHKVPATRAETDDEDKLDKNGYSYTSRNQVTHWWDASQIYGSDAATIKKIRSEYNVKTGKPTGKLMPYGKIAVDEVNRKLIYDQEAQLPITGFHDNWWLGLEMIHTLFHLEHNRIIDEILLPQVAEPTRKRRGKIRSMNKSWKKLCVGVSKESPECANELFEYARLINAALLAKIHTVEWTPALLNHPMLHIAMRGNWFGLRELIGGDSETLRSMLPAHIKHVVSGLVGPETLDLYSTPFTLTEEFVSVYRMHPLVPENINYRSLDKISKTEKVALKDVVFRKTVGKTKNSTTKNAKNIKGSSANWMLSFGTSHPGGLTLHNYPTFMQNFVAERNTGPKHSDSVKMDMGAIDILRDRERGVPRYNDFRRALSLPPIETFSELTDNKKDIATLEDIYNGDVEQLDLLVGSLAEKDRYPGYAFGNTPFWIFAIMASRRLMADPFFSDYFTDDVYTKRGRAHVQKTTMADVIVRHFPELKSQFYETKLGPKRRYGGSAIKTRKMKDYLRVKNAFRPWRPVYEEVKAEMDNAGK